MCKNVILAILTTVICACLTGCSNSVQVEPLGNGYEEVTYTRTSINGEPSSHRISLQYRNAEGKQIMIWPSLDGTRPVVNGYVVVFAGMAALEPPDPDEPRAVNSRVFAVRAPDLPLDITSEILWRWSKESGGDFARFKEATGIVWPQEKDNKVEFHILIGADKNSDPFYDWNQISDIMREVKAKGVVRKDRVWGTSYIEKEFQGDVQK